MSQIGKARWRKDALKKIDSLDLQFTHAAVATYIKHKSYVKAQHQQMDILTTLKSDFDKYKTKISPDVIRSTFTSVIRQTCGKFNFSDERSNISHQQSKASTTLLERARIAHRITGTHANGIPLGGDINPKSNKYLLLDTGLYLHECKLNISELAIRPIAEFINNGKLAEMLIGLELLKSGDPFRENSLFYWHREAVNSTAEVDYLMQINETVLPIEVKSGTRGAMKSLHMLMAEKSLSLGIRTSQENLGILGNVRIIPHYMISDWKRLLTDIK